MRVPGCPVDARLGGDGDAAVARAEEEVRVDPPAVGLRRGEARDPVRRLLGERVEHRRRAEERQAERVGPGGDGAGDDAVVLPRQGGHAQAGQLIHGRRGPLRIGRGVPDHQLERSSVDPAGVIDVANGQLESGEQVPARLDPAGPGQRNESADPDTVVHAEDRLLASRRSTSDLSAEMRQDPAIMGRNPRILLSIVVSLVVTSEASATVAVQRGKTVWVASGGEQRLRRLVRGTDPVVMPGGHVVLVRSSGGKRLFIVPARGGTRRTVAGMRLPAREPVRLRPGVDGRHVLIQRIAGPDAVVDTATGEAHELPGVQWLGTVAPGGAEVAHVRRLGQGECDLAITKTLGGETRSLRRASCGAVVLWGSQGLWLIESSDGTSVWRIAPDTGEVQARVRTRLTVFPVDVAGRTGRCACWHAMSPGRNGRPRSPRTDA